MAITYRWLVNEVDSLTHMYWVDPKDKTEDEGIEGYIKDYRTTVLEVIWEEIVKQIHWKEADNWKYKIDEWTVVSNETITSISNELDAIKISEEMIIAFEYFLDKEEYDIFDTILEIYDIHGNQDICEHIAASWILDQVKANSILYKLYYYCDQWKKFIEAIWLFLTEKWVKLDDFRKTWELDIDEEAENFIHDIQRLILAKVWYVQMSTAFH